MMKPTCVGTLHRIEEIMRQENYIMIFEENLKHDARKLELGRRWWFQHDNDPKHKAKVVTELFITMERIVFE